jgi:hypothetical protein
MVILALFGDLPDLPVLPVFPILPGLSDLTAQQTRAERTGYRETSSHADVLAFLDSLERAGAVVRRGTLGHSAEGREIPWLVLSRPMVDGPAEAHRAGKPVVFLQGNIHGGEIEGKEAALMLLRDLTLGPLRPLLDSVVLLVVPIYNADGNDAFGPGNRQRPGQNGPDLIGRRPNGQGLDLNRDYVKQEAPETRGAALLIDAWDPDLFIDLHTTNGSYHGYVLTYAPGLNPNSSPANDYVRDRFLPTIRSRMRERHRQEVFWYGNFRNQHPDSLTQGWETYDARPRFGTNWFGMRGGLAILSEAYSNADLRTRVSATYNFVVEVLRLAVEERATVFRVRAAGVPRPDSITVRSRLAAPRLEEVIAEITEPAGEGTGGFSRRRRTGVFRTIRMPVFDRFAAERREALPIAYLLPPQHAPVADGLRRHGIRVGRITAPWQGPGEAFRVDSLIASSTPFEGHREVRVEGSWQVRELAVTPGWFLVPTDQRLGVLAAYLLEPSSEDGFVTWNFFDRDLRRGRETPVVRLRGVSAPRSIELP